MVSWPVMDLTQVLVLTAGTYTLEGPASAQCVYRPDGPWPGCGGGGSVIYAIDLVPHRVGLVGGLFYGLAFGLGGLAAAAVGVFADQIGIIAVFKLCAWLPALGLLTFMLPRAPSGR